MCQTKRLTKIELEQHNDRLRVANMELLTQNSVARNDRKLMLGQLNEAFPKQLDSMLSDVQRNAVQRIRTMLEAA